MWEMRHLYGDQLYQVFRRFNRLGDPFQTYMVPTALTSLYLLSSQHIAFLVYKIINKEWFFISFLCFNC